MNRTPPTCIREQLALDEGREHEIYPDSQGWQTIGIGHNLQTKDRAKIPAQFANGLTDAQINALFEADLAHVVALLAVYIPWWAVDGEYGPRAGVLLNMSFNMGVAGLAKFHGFLAFMQGGHWQAAANDLRTTAVFRQLPARYERLARQTESGIWQ